ncbi:hypothetical protein D3C86_2028350 [compost metagenome]
MAGDELVTHLHWVTDIERRLLRIGRAPWSLRTGERIGASREFLQALLSDRAFLDEERRHPDNDPIVVAGGQVLPGLHALDRMPEFIHIE